MSNQIIPFLWATATLTFVVRAIAAWQRSADSMLGKNLRSVGKSGLVAALQSKVAPIPSNHGRGR